MAFWLKKKVIMTLFIYESFTESITWPLIHHDWLKIPLIIHQFHVSPIPKTFLVNFIFKIIICGTIRCMQEFGDLNHSGRFQTRWKTLILEELCAPLLQTSPGRGFSASWEHKQVIFLLVQGLPWAFREVDPAFHFSWLYAPELWSLKIQISGWKRSSFSTSN